MRVVTSCTFDCPDTCSLIVETDPAGAIRVEGNPSHPITAGFVCGKVRRWAETLRSPSRITRPLIRRGDAWATITWDEALGLCAERVQSYRTEPSSILHISSLGNKGVAPLAGHLLFGSLGASRVSGSLCDNAGISGCIEDFGELDHNEITDLARSRRIVNWGKDLSRSSVHVAALVRQARRNGARVLTISPGGDGNAGFSTHLVRIRPGTDRFLAAAVIRLLWQRDRIDPAIPARTANWPAMESILRLRSPLELARACDASMTDVEAVYEMYAEPGPAATLMGYGLQRYVYGAENVRFVNALALLAGNIGVSGGGSYFNISSVRNFNLNWAFSPAEGHRRTFDLPTIGHDALGAHDPPVRMIWVNGCNVVNQAPDSRAVAGALAAAEFVVVVGAFMDDTARRAHLILPTTLMWEQEDVIGSFMHNYVHHVAPVVEPPPEARSDHWVFRELGRRLDPAVSIPDLDAVFGLALDSPYLYVSLDELRRRRWVRAARPEVAFADGRFSHPDGRYRFPEALHDELPGSEGFSLRLLTLVRREAIHSQILPEAQQGPPIVWIAPESRILEGLDLTRDVYLASPLGRLRVRVATLPGLHPAACIYRRGDWMALGGGANQLIDATVTDLGGGAAFYEQWVTLEN